MTNNVANDSIVAYVCQTISTNITKIMENLIKNCTLYDHKGAFKTQSKAKTVKKSTTRIVLSKPQIPTLIFNHLMSEIQCDCADLNGLIGYSSEHEHWSLSFYSDLDIDTTITLEDFGFTYQDRWIQCEPTIDQLFEMQKYIDDKINELEIQKSEQESDEAEDKPPINLYQQNGVSRQSFL